MSLKDRWDEARAGRHRQRIRMRIEHEEWDRALNAVIDFAQWADGRIQDPGPWLDMTVLATHIVAHLDDSAEYSAFLTHFADPFLGDEHRPRPELLEAFASIATSADPEVMSSIGRWLTDARPRWPLGPYLMAHFDERRLDDADGPPLKDVASHFALTERRADSADLDHWRRHARLRRGSLLLLRGGDHGEARRLLADIDWSKLTTAEQLWMATALANSSRWTDRMRAMDIVLDLHRTRSSGRPGGRDVRTSDLRTAAAAIFKLSGLELPDAEKHRLQQLADDLFIGDECDRWHHFLSARQRLSNVGTLPFEQSPEVRPLLEKLAAVYPDRWEVVSQRFRILEAGWHGDYDDEAALPSNRQPDDRLRIFQAVSRVLNTLQNPDGEDGSLQERLEELFDCLEGIEATDDAAAARPLALIWPLLVDSAKESGSPPAEAARLAELHTAHAPPPGYGWWTLAAHLYDVDLDDAATLIAEHALRTEQHAPRPVVEFVASRRFQRATDDADRDAARRWIDRLP